MALIKQKKFEEFMDKNPDVRAFLNKMCGDSSNHFSQFNEAASRFSDDNLKVLNVTNQQLLAGTALYAFCKVLIDFSDNMPTALGIAVVTTMFTGVYFALAKIGLNSLDALKNKGEFKSDLVLNRLKEKAEAYKGLDEKEIEQVQKYQGFKGFYLSQ